MGQQPKATGETMIPVFPSGRSSMRWPSAHLLATDEADWPSLCLLRAARPGAATTVPYAARRNDLAISRLLAKYKAVPMSLADACLVALAESLPRAKVLAIDSDFRLYRKHGRQVIPVTMPNGS